MPEERRMGDDVWNSSKDKTIPIENGKKEKCSNCQRILFVGVMGSGTHIEIKCKHCKVKTRFHKP